MCKYLYVYVCGYVEVDFYICFSVCFNTYARTDTCVGVHLYNSVRKYYWHFCFSLFFFVPPCRVSIIHHRVHCCERRRESKSQIGAKRVYSCNCGMEGFSSIVIDGTSVEKIGNGMRVSFFFVVVINSINQRTSLYKYNCAPVHMLVLAMLDDLYYICSISLYIYIYILTFIIIFSCTVFFLIFIYFWCCLLFLPSVWTVSHSLSY